MNIELANILLIHASFLSTSLLRCNKSLATLLHHKNVIRAIIRSGCRRIVKMEKTNPEHVIIQVADILFNHAAFASVPLFRCNRWLASRLHRKDVIQNIRKSVCKRIATEISRIPYSIDEDGAMSRRMIGNRRWVVMYISMQRWSGHYTLYMMSEFVVPFPDTTNGIVNVHLSSKSLVEKRRRIWNGTAMRYGFIHPSFGWERGAARYSTRHAANDTMLQGSIISKEETADISTFFELQCQRTVSSMSGNGNLCWFQHEWSHCGKPCLLNMYKREYQDKCLQRYTDLFYEEEKANRIPARQEVAEVQHEPEGTWCRYDDEDTYENTYKDDDL